MRGLSPLLLLAITACATVQWHIEPVGPQRPPAADDAYVVIVIFPSKDIELGDLWNAVYTGGIEHATQVLCDQTTPPEMTFDIKKMEKQGVFLPLARMAVDGGRIDPDAFRIYGEHTARRLGGNIIVVTTAETSDHIGGNYATSTEAVIGFIDCEVLSSLEYKGTQL